MKKWLKYTLAATGLLVGILLIVGGWAEWRHPAHFPEAPRPDLHASTDPDMIARGHYLFHAVAHCTACHAPKEKLAGLGPTEEAVPSGGHEWVLGPFGVVRSPNITSDADTGIGKMTDAELARLITHGVHDDDTVAMLMIGVGAMAERDVVALMSYVRTLPAVKNSVEPSHINTAGKVLLGNLAAHLFMPKYVDLPTFVEEAAEPSVARGEYLVRGPAFCFACHSPLEVNAGHVKLTGPLMSGGDVVPEPDGEMELVPPNITVHKERGRIGGWSEEVFMARMRAGRAHEHSPMPWENYRLMTDSDLRSIYRFLRSVPASDRNVGPDRRPAGWTPKT